MVLAPACRAACRPVARAGSGGRLGARGRGTVAQGEREPGAATAVTALRTATRPSRERESERAMGPLGYSFRHLNASHKLNRLDRAAHPRPTLPLSSTAQAASDLTCPSFLCPRCAWQFSPRGLGGCAQTSRTGGARRRRASTAARRTGAWCRAGRRRRRRKWAN